MDKQVDGALKLGFIALKSIAEGQEVLVDYGHQPNPPRGLTFANIIGGQEVSGTSVPPCKINAE